MNSKIRRTSEELVGIDDQKNMILGMIKQEESRVIGLWGMGGIGKTTLADVVYKEASPNFGSRCFLQNVSEKIKNQGWVTLRNELLSKLLNEKEIRIDTISIEYPYQERLNNKRVIVVLDDVSDQDHIDYMGVKHFGPGSKIVVTSRDRQVLKNGEANIIHEVNKLNRVDSLQLFSTFAFKLLNPTVDFQDLSNKFVNYAQGNPLALKVLGSKLYTKPKREWESEADKLKEYGQPQISQILKSSFDGLDELEKNIFLDIACFLKRKDRYEIEEILKMGNDIVRQECKDPTKCSRLGNPKDVVQGTDLIEGIKLDMSQIGNLKFRPTVFEKMHNLRYIHFYFPPFSAARHADQVDYKKLYADGVDSIYLPDELRVLHWPNYPFKSLSSFNPHNLVVLELTRGNIEQLWNEDDHLDPANLRKINVSYCKNLRKIPNLIGAINLKSLICTECRSLVEFPCLNHLASLETLQLEGCLNLKKFPEVPTHFSTLYLGQTGIGEVPDSIEKFLGT
ncbi:disease resistance-like protein DSC1 [Hibiscus syriacus]|nr:disease resistance-like protein DSC1 [Hibiscus syriacus]